MHYAHIPVVLNAQGEKLSKQTRAVAVDDHQPAAQLWQALEFLQQSPPASIRNAPTADIWQWAHENWRLGRIRPSSLSAD
jgi:glutamyl-Q tRNA(Asp) synthetase